MTDWRQKIIAYLRDPPEKAYDYSPEHCNRAERHLANLKIPEAQWKGKEPDHIAAAADRFIFPSSSQKQGDHYVRTGVPGLGERVSFKHPLTGDPAFGNEGFPAEEEAHQIISDALPDFCNEDEQVKFWLLWRLWLQYSVDHVSAKQNKADRLAYLPADTRIPDGSIWHHMSIASALESTRDASGNLKPAFLMFQLGPVQEFIRQGRSTRDSWSGSYLISWMMAHVLKGLADQFGPDSVIFPSLRGQPLYDWLEKDKLEKAFHSTKDGRQSKNFWDTFQLGDNPDLFLTPNLPNRLLAIVPADSEKLVTQIIDDVFCTDYTNSAWSMIADKSWEYLNKRQNGSQQM